MEKDERKMYFTRKNLIFFALLFFYLLICIFVAICIDSTNPIFKANNPIQGIVNVFKMPLVNAGINAYMLFFCCVVYIMIFAVVFVYEYRFSMAFYKKVWTTKSCIIYGVSFVLCLGLFIGISLVSQIPFETQKITNSFIFLGESLFIGLIIFILLASIITAIFMLYVNFKNVDKPFRFFGNKLKKTEEEEEIEELKEEIKQDQQGLLEESLEGKNYQYKNNLQSNSDNNVGGDANGGVVALSDKEIVFPGLCGIDYFEENKQVVQIEKCSLYLKDMVTRFRNYLAKEEHLYFEESTIRAFIAGMSASRLIILEGLSGTGKSSLARYFSDFISEKSFFEPVQATWHDRTSILGYYNDFLKKYNETEFLKRLYLETYELDHINIMVLDEINISRVEYYFADFLSILEYPLDSWKLKILELPYQFEAPSHLEDGILNIPYNTWFIGTANKDDSTFTITDKVYDRAISISFSDRNEPFEVNGESSKIILGYDELMNLFNDAINNKDCQLSNEDYSKFKKLVNYTYETFDITFGNRIMNQIEILVPVYFACGGTKEDALDFMFSRKVISKLEGRFEDYIKQALINLKKLINETYGETYFKETRHLIDRLIKKL